MPSSEPPLNAVRVFVAAARQLSFTRAAAELHVTHSAVSRQIRSLEGFLGVALFERRIRQVALTAEGQQFYAEVEPALEQIGAAARALSRPVAGRAAVRINVRPSFALRWLIPRLPDFVERYPDIEPQVVTSTQWPSLEAEGFDVAVRRGLEGWAQAMQVHPFLDDEVLVVGAPSLFAAQPLVDLCALASHVLLSAKTRKADWDDWRKCFGAPRGRQAGRLQFDHLHFVMQAAVDGLGLALAPTSLLAHDLASGRLQAALPDLRMPLTRYYYGLAPGATPEARCVADWFEEMRRAQVLQTQRTASRGRSR
ncbi:LysR substrate-binding domain-containing protein [Variovorax sp. PBL-H6]|uniref:LysR substrate-binding domain-containing protein n=1 Tax=Variovorax sp. PBL-H6 TaxID=434009 RepID=UPI0013A5A022|nr:LysR substrate-binding domain-containing protein [Variovorax sp. PBL-H6]